jgi:hypothetical protein
MPERPEKLKAMTFFAGNKLTTGCIRLEVMLSTLDHNLGGEIVDRFMGYNCGSMFLPAGICSFLKSQSEQCTVPVALFAQVFVPIDRAQ